MTGLEAAKESKRRAFEQSEIIDAMGQDSDRKAAVEVKRWWREEEKREDNYRDNQLNILEANRKNWENYFKSLVQVFYKFLAQEDIPQKFVVSCRYTKVGLVIKIRGTNRVGAFKVCFDPFLDYNACKVMAVKTGNTVAKLMGLAHRTPQGIYLPDAEDKQLYGHNKPRKN